MRTTIIGRSGSMSPLGEIAGLPPRHDGVLSFHRRSRSSKLTLDLQERRDQQSPMSTSSPLRRVRSESDLLRSPVPSSRWSSPVSLVVKENQEIDLTTGVCTGAGTVAEVEIEEIEHSGGGMGSGRKIGRGSGGEGDGGADRNEDRRIGSYYQEMLRADPANPLLLRNYGKYLHEVERDLKRAEEFYGRAILASPRDGELLSLYGRLIWESQMDGKRAESYYERAVEASPDDCYVMGSYAHFLWDAEEEEGDGDGEVSSSSPWVKAF